MCKFSFSGVCSLVHSNIYEPGPGEYMVPENMDLFEANSQYASYD